MIIQFIFSRSSAWPVDSVKTSCQHVLSLFCECILKSFLWELFNTVWNRKINCETLAVKHFFIPHCVFRKVQRSANAFFFFLPKEISLSPNLTPDPSLIFYFVCAQEAERARESVMMLCLSVMWGRRKSLTAWESSSQFHQGCESLLSYGNLQAKTGIH